MRRTGWSDLERALALRDDRGQARVRLFRTLYGFTEARTVMTRPIPPDPGPEPAA